MHDQLLRKIQGLKRKARDKTAHRSPGTGISVLMGHISLLPLQTLTAAVISMLLLVHRVQLLPLQLSVMCPSLSVGNVNLYCHVHVHTAMHVKSKSEDKANIWRK